MNHAFTPVIVIHLATALAALGIGSLLFLRTKGTASHRLLGRAWASLMLVTAISSFWIRASGSFSWIHGLSVFTLIALAGGVYYAVKGRIGAHRKTMQGLYFGGLIVAGAFTLMPERLLGRMVWSALGLA